MKQITWPLAAIVVAALAGVTVIYSASDSSTRSAVIGLMITVTTTLAAVYARSGTAQATDQLAAQVADLARDLAGVKDDVADLHRPRPRRPR